MTDFEEVPEFGRGVGTHRGDVTEGQQKKFMPGPDTFVDFRILSTARSGPSGETVGSHGTPFDLGPEVGDASTRPGIPRFRSAWR
jgi:hypothetical protein